VIGGDPAAAAQFALPSSVVRRCSSGRIRIHHVGSPWPTPRAAPVTSATITARHVGARSSDSNAGDDVSLFAP